MNNRAPLKLKEPPPETLTRLRAIERRFHERAFGEELACANLDLTLADRRVYVQWMRRVASQHGVPSKAIQTSRWIFRLENEQ